MAEDEGRARFLRDRVMTATPAQRVVMLYDRFGLDLTLAEGTQEVAEYGAHLSHALDVLANLQGSLDLSAGGPAANLASLYSYVLMELLAARGGDRSRIPGVRTIMESLRGAWAQVADDAAITTNAPRAAAGSWVS